MKVCIACGTTADLPQIRALLEQNDLPCDGLADRVATTLVGRADGRIVGPAALELFVDAALLRLVAVDVALRGQGVGHQLTEAALHLSRQQSMREVYLLTETAADFFACFGFHPILRPNVAPAVQQSVEFTTACPASALVMVHAVARR